MTRLLLIPSLTILVILLIVLIVTLLSKRSKVSRDEELDKKYIYRKEPHADQVTEHPNRLEDNDITRG
jgi:FtsZ-interacting cell division protein ZipA